MQTHNVTVRSIRALRGPNLYAYMPAMKVEMDIGPYEEMGSDAFPGFVERLTSWLPGLHQHGCSLGRPGGFVERLHRGTYLPHITEHVTLELQNMMGFKVSFGRARGTGARGVYTVVFAYKEEEPARAAFDTALRLTLAAMHDEPFDIEVEVENLLALADRYRFGPSTAAIVDAARKRKIPVMRLTPQASLVQLGWGVHQKRIRASETSNTSAIAVGICQEKQLTNHMLRTVGVPVPGGQVVRLADRAWAVARELGLPVVVKPAAGNQGKGVSVNLTSEADVRAAYEIARNFSRDVLVEQAIQGHDYRLLVVNGTLVAAARRDPAQVVGDGEHTVTELVEIINRDPRRRPGHSGTLTRIKIDQAVDLVLDQQGLSPDSVPEPGQVVTLRANCNLSTGGTATDVTDEVHPRNVQIAQLAAQILALDVAGVDVICQDISRPLSEQGGAIVEVNAAPGLRMHLSPAEGQPRDGGSPIVEMLYPDGTPSRIPLIAVTGTNGKTTVTRLIGHMYNSAHLVVGMTSTDGVYIGKERIMKGDCAGPRSAQAVLLHPAVEVAVLETARGGILREGLAFDECRVGVVTNISEDHLGIGGIDTREDLARVKQVVVEAVSRQGAAVLNADDPLVAEMAAATSSEVVYFSSKPDNHIISPHLAGGGRSVLRENNRIVLAEGERRIDLVDLARVGFTGHGNITFQVENALAATAAAWAAGLNPAIIARALTTFTSDPASTPGRFNVSESNGVQVIVDYGHNSAALRALLEGAGALGQRRTILVIALPGDRRDQDLCDAIHVTLPYVDEYVFYEARDLRGRPPWEISRLSQGCLTPDHPSVIASSQVDGIKKGMERARPGDRLIIIVEDVDEALSVVRKRDRCCADDTTCEAPIAPDLVAVQ